MNVKERIIEFLDSRKISKRGFASSIGKSNSYVNNIVSTITADVITKIKEVYPDLNINWLLTGEGEMLKSNTENKPYLTTKSGTKYYDLPNGKFKMIVPHVPIQAYAGYVDDYRDAEFIEKLEEREFTVNEIHFGKYYSFEIKGDSMDNDTRDSLVNGDIVLVRDLGKEHWKDLRFKDYKAWIIVLKNTIVCKQIIAQDMQKGTLTCHSLNPSPEYSDFDLDINDICQLMNVIKRESNY